VEDVLARGELLDELPAAAHPDHVRDPVRPEVDAAGLQELAERILRRLGLGAQRVHDEGALLVLARDRARSPQVRLRA
jgi:hypothetical protein